MSSYSLTGNEEDSSFTYTIGTDQLYKFSKTITVNTDPDSYEFKYDIYEETFIFPTYRFTVGKHIPKIKCDVTEEFVKNYECSIENEDFCFRWITNKDVMNIIHPIEPNEMLKEYSQQLYDKYVKYYDQVVNEKPYIFYYFFKH